MDLVSPSRAAALLVASVFACTDGGDEPSAPAQVTVVVDEPVTLHGSCDGGRPLGPITNYRHVIELDRDEPRVRVRADPNWPAGDHANVLGELASPQRIPAFGPVKGIPSNGIGWVVPLRDDSGRTCRGYVSATVAEPVECDRVTTPLVAFPDALDVTPGPCAVR